MLEMGKSGKILKKRTFFGNKNETRQHDNKGSEEEKTTLTAATATSVILPVNGGVYWVLVWSIVR
jgi:hypothetical protein